MNDNHENRLLLARYWLVKSDESLASAESEFDAGRLSFAVNRLYYALFYGMSAILAVKGEQVSKHTAVRAAFHKDYVRTGIIPNELGQLYTTLFTRRHQMDYTPLASVEQSTVLEYTANTKKLLKELHFLAEKEINAGNG